MTRAFHLLNLQRVTVEHRRIDSERVARHGGGMVGIGNRGVSLCDALWSVWGPWSASVRWLFKWPPRFPTISLCSLYSTFSSSLFICLLGDDDDDEQCSTSRKPGRLGVLRNCRLRPEKAVSATRGKKIKSRIGCATFLVTLPDFPRFEGTADVDGGALLALSAKPTDSLPLPLSPLSDPPLLQDQPSA